MTKYNRRRIGVLLALLLCLMFTWWNNWRIVTETVFVPVADLAEGLSGMRIAVFGKRRAVMQEITFVPKPVDNLVKFILERLRLEVFAKIVPCGEKALAV